MEKLVLRGILWGADKVPDAWFEKIPGGYYKPKQDKIAQVPNDKRHSRHASHSSRTYDDYGDRQQRLSHRPRSLDLNNHNRPVEAYYQTQSARLPNMRERDLDDDYGDDRYHRSRAAEREPPYPVFGRQHANKRDGPLSPGPIAGAAAASSRFDASQYPSPPLSTASPAPQTRGISTGGYVPYGDIYGQGGRDRPEPSVMSPGSERADLRSPPAAEGRVYNSDRAPPGQYSDSQASYDPNPASRNRPRDYDNPRSYRDYGRDSGMREPREYDDYDDYESDRGYGRARSQSTRRGASRERSPSTLSYYDANGRRRARSEQRHGASVTSSKQSKKDKIKEKLDTTEDGLKYGALGAFAGGLIGNELGGIIPTALGAAVGALGGSAYQAREKYVPCTSGSVFHEFRADNDIGRKNPGSEIHSRRALLLLIRGMTTIVTTADIAMIAGIVTIVDIAMTAVIRHEKFITAFRRAKTRMTINDFMTFDFGWRVRRGHARQPRRMQCVRLT
jgi:hypothetical protein